MEIISSIFCLRGKSKVEQIKVSLHKWCKKDFWDDICICDDEGRSWFFS